MTCGVWIRLPRLFLFEARAGVSSLLVEAHRSRIVACPEVGQKRRSRKSDPISTGKSACGQRCSSPALVHRTPKPHNSNPAAQLTAHHQRARPALNRSPPQPSHHVHQGYKLYPKTTPPTPSKSTTYSQHPENRPFPSTPVTSIRKIFSTHQHPAYQQVTPKDTLPNPALRPTPIRNLKESLWNRSSPPQHATARNYQNSSTAFANSSPLPAPR